MVASLSGADMVAPTYKVPQVFLRTSSGRASPFAGPLALALAIAGRFGEFGSPTCRSLLLSTCFRLSIESLRAAECKFFELVELVLLVLFVLLRLPLLLFISPTPSNKLGLLMRSRLLFPAFWFPGEGPTFFPVKRLLALSVVIDTGPAK